jgi:hypothetical protein
MHRQIIMQRPEKAEEEEEKHGQQRGAHVSSEGVHVHMHPLFVFTADGISPYTISSFSSYNFFVFSS